ncbi:MAG TPA: SprT family zinc-dependent metalloprotease [bacterium]|nr:SprT family zinc-dependent metalloprotease [bacterium]
MGQEIIDRIIRSKRRTLALQIAPDASLVVRAPLRVSLETIRKMVRCKLPWIVEKQRVAREAARTAAARTFSDGERFLFLGEWRTLCAGADQEEPLVFDGKEFRISEKHRSRAREHFEEWYREQARGIIRERVRRLAEISGSAYKRVSITGAGRRWGSCGPRGTLNFSWRLIMAPLPVVDYVVVHELVHLEERNHDASRFWRKVGALMPEYREYKAWLKNNEHVVRF